MDHRSRWDHDMRAARDAMDAIASRFAPVTVQEPMDAARAVNDAINLPFSEGGPAMARSEDRWVFAQGRRILCRMHRPTDVPDLPVLIWFHGGGWVWCSLDTHDRLCREYAAGAGVATVSVDYTLSPEARFPQALLECAAVVRHLAEHGRDWGIDPSRMLIGGDSAGGNLALATALLLRDTSGPAIRGVVAPYPVTDADFDTDSYRSFAADHGLTRDGMRAYWNLYTRDAADRLNPLAAPLRGNLSGLPPLLIQVAELDVLHSDGTLFAERARDAGVDVTLEEYTGVLHGFMRMTEAVAKARDGVRSACAWIRSRVGTA